MDQNHSRGMAGMAGLAALRRLAYQQGAVRGCDERLLEKLLRRVLNDLSAFSEALIGKPSGTWYQGATGYLPDLVAEDEEGQFLAGLEVKTRALINWARYGTETYQSQLDRYVHRTEDIGAVAAPLYLVVDTTNKGKVEDALAAIGQSRIASADRWTVLTLTELLQLAPIPNASDTAEIDQAGGPVFDLLISLLAES